MAGVREAASSNGPATTRPAPTTPAAPLRTSEGHGESSSLLSNWVTKPQLPIPGMSRVPHTGRFNAGHSQERLKYRQSKAAAGPPGLTHQVHRVPPIGLGQRLLHKALPPPSAVLRKPWKKRKAVSPGTSPGSSGLPRHVQGRHGPGPQAARRGGQTARLRVTCLSPNNPGVSLGPTGESRFTPTWRA